MYRSGEVIQLSNDHRLDKLEEKVLMLLSFARDDRTVGS